MASRSRSVLGTPSWPLRMHAIPETCPEMKPEGPKTYYRTPCDQLGSRCTWILRTREFSLKGTHYLPMIFCACVLCLCCFAIAVTANHVLSTPSAGARMYPLVPSGSQRYVCRIPKSFSDLRYSPGTSSAHLSQRTSLPAAQQPVSMIINARKET